jgi:hypothetical protein
MPAEVLASAEISISDSVSATSHNSTGGDPESALAGFSAIARPKGPKLLLSDEVRVGDGAGPAVALNEFRAKLLVVTLDITDVVERTGLSVSVWGSENQSDWGIKPLLTFRQRQYCGVYSVLLNMAMHPEMRFLRVQWSMNRCGRTVSTPLFGFEVFMEESGARVSSSAVA